METQKATNDGKDRFQVRIRHKGPKTNHDRTWDYLVYGGPLYKVKFHVTCIP